MSGVTGRDPPPCQHPAVLTRGATGGYDICAICGAAVYNTVGPQVTYVVRCGAIPDDVCKKSDKPKWNTPPGSRQGKKSRYDR